MQKKPLVVNKLFSIAVNDLDAKKSAGFSQMLIVTKLESEIQCNQNVPKSRIQAAMKLYPTH